jgi:hypothetical protein
MEKIFKPFDLEKAIAGEPICNAYGDRLKFVAYEPGAKEPVICLVDGAIESYSAGGIFNVPLNGGSDLRMAEDVNESLCRLLQDEAFLVDGRAGRVEEQARAIRKVLGL